MARTRAKLKDVASEVDLSVSAVSRILNGKGKEIGLSDATIAKVEVASERLGYRPHSQAQALRLGRTNIIGVCLVMPSNSLSDFSFRLLSGISRTLIAHAKLMLLYDTEDHAGAVRAIQSFREHRVDGVIATHRDYQPYIAAVNQLIDDRIPVVTIDSPQGGIFHCPNVGVDNAQGAILAVEHLIRKGHRKIGYLTHSLSESDSGGKRLAGFKSALAAHGLPYSEELVCNISLYADVYEAARHFLSRDSVPDAVFCWNDTSAFALQRVYRDEFNSQMPEIEIVGFDGREFVPFLESPFATIRQPRFEIGQRAVELLLDGGGHERDVLLKPELVHYERNHMPFGLIGF